MSARKQMAWYAAAFGVAPPLRVLLVPSVCLMLGEHEEQQQRVSAGVVDALSRRVARELGCAASVAVSSCCLAALQSQGRDALAVVMALKQGATRVACDHQAGTAPLECVAALCAAQAEPPSLAALVGTADEARILRRTALGLPVLVHGVKKLALEAPSKRTRELARQRGLDKVAAQVVAVAEPVAAASIERRPRTLSRKEKKRIKGLKRLREKELAADAAQQAQPAKRKRKRKHARKSDDVDGATVAVSKPG